MDIFTKFRFVFEIQNFISLNLVGVVRLVPEEVLQVLEGDEGEGHPQTEPDPHEQELNKNDHRSGGAVKGGCH